MTQEKKDSLPKRWIDCEVEEEYFGEKRKESKQQVKQASAKDRSHRKKSDRDQALKAVKTPKISQESPGSFFRGRVLSIASQEITVEHEGRVVTCILRGILKKEATESKNLVTVGDFVFFDKLSDSTGTIAAIEPRKTVLSRADNISRRKEQLIAANIDQVLITVSVVDPALKPFLVDRYIIATRIGGMEPIIVVNKIDLLEDLNDDDDEKALYLEFISAYKKANIPLVEVSVETGEGLDHLRDIMKGKASVFSGQSGVGKSSLINIITGSDLRVGRTVDKTRKGAHTTTTARLLPLSFGGFCIDTPGIKSFGVWSLKKDQIEGYFSEIWETGKGCFFQNCTHSGEKECAVLQAVEAGDISPLRYDSYQALIESVSEEHVRR